MKYFRMHKYYNALSRDNKNKASKEMMKKSAELIAL